MQAFKAQKQQRPGISCQAFFSLVGVADYEPEKQARDPGEGRWPKREKPQNSVLVSPSSHAHESKLSSHS